MIAKGKSISHGTAALEYDLAKEINGEAAATEIHRHELFGCTGEDMVQEMKPYFVDFPNVKNNCLRFEVSPSVEESAGKPTCIYWQTVCRYRENYTKITG